MINRSVPIREGPRADNPRSERPLPRQTIPKALILLALIVSSGLLGWYAWHGFEINERILTMRAACLRSDEIRDRTLDLAHSLLIASRPAVSTDRPSAEDRYKESLGELDRLLRQTAAFEREWTDGDGSAELVSARSALTRVHRELQDLISSDAGNRSPSAADPSDAASLHNALHDAVNDYVSYFQHRFQRALDAERREHLIVVSITTAGFALCIAAWAVLVQWLNRNHSRLMNEIEQRRTVEAEARVLQKTELLGEVSGALTHDFNNATTAVAGIVALARGELDDPSAMTRRLDQIDWAMQQARHIAGSLLRFGSHTQSEKTALDLGLLARNSLPMLRCALPGRIALDLDSPVPGDDCIIKGNALELEQVILNLVLNAKDALADAAQPRVRLGIRPTRRPETGETGNELVVEDNGCGMSDETRKRVLEPFYTTKPDGRGTGLGAPAARRIIQEHAGCLWFESEPGIGTRAHVWLPAAPECVPSADDHPEDIRVRAKGTILVAEDDPLVRQIVSESLRNEGLDVITVSDGDDLLARYARHSAEIDALVVDHDMPRRNGIDCLRELRRRDSQVPAVLMTGVVDPQLEDDVSSLALLLRKPFAVSELVRVLGVLIGRADGGEAP